MAQLDDVLANANFELEKSGDDVVEVVHKKGDKSDEPLIGKIMRLHWITPDYDSVDDAKAAHRYKRKTAQLGNFWTHYEQRMSQGEL